MVPTQMKPIFWARRRLDEVMRWDSLSVHELEELMHGILVLVRPEMTLAGCAGAVTRSANGAARRRPDAAR